MSKDVDPDLSKAQKLKKIGSDRLYKGDHRNSSDSKLLSFIKKLLKK